jgi:hypothetical protein
MYFPSASDRIPDVERMTPEQIAAAWAARRLPPQAVASPFPGSGGGRKGAA